MAARFDYGDLAGQRKEENCSEGGKSYEGGTAIVTNFRKRQGSNACNLPQTTKQWQRPEETNLPRSFFIGTSQPRLTRWSRVCSRKTGSISCPVKRSSLHSLPVVAPC